MGDTLFEYFLLGSCEETGHGNEECQPKDAGHDLRRDHAEREMPERKPLNRWITRSDTICFSGIIPLKKLAEARMMAYTRGGC